MKIRIQARDGDKVFVEIECGFSKAGTCHWPAWKREPTGTMWNWNGDFDYPTIRPSIDCKGGCGRHFTIVDGKPT